MHAACFDPSILIAIASITVTVESSLRTPSSVRCRPSGALNWIWNVPSVPANGAGVKLQRAATLANGSSNFQ